MQKHLITLIVVLGVITLGMIIFVGLPAFAQHDGDKPGMNADRGQEADQTAAPSGAQDDEAFGQFADIDEDFILVDDPGAMLDENGDMGLLAQADKGTDPGNMSKEKKGKADDLNLSKDQKKQLRDLRTSNQKEMIPLRAQVQVKRIELTELIRSNASQSDIDKKIDEIAALRTTMAKKMIAERMAMRKVLTAEQLDKWDNRPKMGHPFRQMFERALQRHGFRGKGI